MPPSQATDQPPTPSPIPSQSPHRPRFGFGEPKIPDDPPSNQPPNPGSFPTEEELLEELEQDLGDDGAEYDPSLSDGPPTSSSASSRVANPLVGEGLRDMFRGGVIFAGEGAHEYLARSEGQKAVGLYLADQQDAEHIGDPLARIAARHQGLGEVSPDTADLLAAMVGLTRYATRQIGKRSAAAAFDAGTIPTEAVDV